MKINANYRTPNPPPLESITITLSPQEAEYLQTVSNRIGGPTDGPRGFFDELRKELNVLGIIYNENILDKTEKTHQGIYLKTPNV